jgi:flagellar hook-basal body complex protein FliE
MAIQSITSAIGPGLAPPSVGAASNAGGGGFADALSKLVSSVEDATSQSNSAVVGMLDGTVDVHDAMIAMQQADIALQLTMQIRNKLVQAYQEIMRMPI